MNGTWHPCYIISLLFIVWGSIKKAHAEICCYNSQTSFSWQPLKEIFFPLFFPMQLFYLCEFFLLSVLIVSSPPFLSLSPSLSLCPSSLNVVLMSWCSFLLAYPLRCIFIFLFPSTDLSHTFSSPHFLHSHPLSFIEIPNFSSRLLFHQCYTFVGGMLSKVCVRNVNHSNVPLLTFSKSFVASVTRLL